MSDESELGRPRNRDHPVVFVSYAHDSESHKALVLEFCTFLRSIGVDAQLDMWAAHGRHQWSKWAMRELYSAHFILVIASPEYKKRAEGHAPPDEGRGAQFEASIILDQLSENQSEAHRRILPVILPGRSKSEVPAFLNPYSTTCYEIEEFTPAGVNLLLQAFHGMSQLSMPPLGEYLGPSQPAGYPVQDEPSARPTAGAPRANSRLLTELDHVSRDTDLRNTGAELNGKHYGNSIVHRCSPFCSNARSAVEYNLGRAYRRFESTVGVLDDAADARQIAYFQVFLDGAAQPQVRAALGAPVDLGLDVAGVLRLKLVAYRTDAVDNPMLAGARAAFGRAGNLPALAWGDPTLYA